VNDADFDNFDNPYAEIKLHRYTNMNDKYDTEGNLDNPIIDEVLNIKECDDEESYEDIWNANHRKYCPDFKQEDFLYAD